MGKGHARNEDAYLNKGGVNEIAASDVKGVVTNFGLHKDATIGVHGVGSGDTLAKFSDITKANVGLTNVTNNKQIPEPASPQLGDIIYFDGSNWLRLPAGSVGQVLTMVSPIDSYTKLLMHFNSFPFIDEIGKIPTNTGATLNTSVKKFGAGSSAYNGSAALTFAANADFTFGTGAWTVEGWFYATSLPSTKVLFGANEDHRWGIAYEASSSSFAMYLSSDGVSWDMFTYSSVITFDLNTWVHIAFTFDGSNYRLFYNGAIVGIVTTSTPVYYGTNATFFIGGNGLLGGGWIGYIDEIRVSKGVARWVTTFTPPAIEYSSALLPQWA